MSSKPAVSVIISTHNRATLLPRALRSVLLQTFHDFELIVVDDASVDNTDEVMQEFIDERIRYIRHEMQKGGPAARNTGIRESRGTYIAFLDDDDEWLAGKLSGQHAKISSSSEKVGVIYCGGEVVSESGKIIRKDIPLCRGNVLRDLLWGPLFGSVTKALIRRECFDRAGYFDENLKSCQDWDMWLRIAKYYDFDYVPEILCRIHQHESQISNNFASVISGRIALLEKYHDAMAAYPHTLIQHYKQVGKFYMLSGKKTDAAQWFDKAIALRSPERFKILAWRLFELPYLLLFSNFRHYRDRAVE